MNDFDLVSIDWDSVRLLQSAQFRHETSYLEDLARWSLQRGRTFGVFHLADNGISAPSPEGEGIHSVSVRGLFGVAQNGSIIDIPDEDDAVVEGHLDARRDPVPLFIGVHLSERDQIDQLSPSRDPGLLQCGGLMRRYVIRSDQNLDGMDWLQVGQFEKDPSGRLRQSDTFVPECLFITSVEPLRRARHEITRLATDALDRLVQHPNKNATMYSVAAALAGSLGAAAIAVNGRIHPRDYMDRLAGILSAQQTQLSILPNPNLEEFDDTLATLQGALDTLRGRYAIGDALRQISQCIKMLGRLYPPLMQSLSAAESAAGPRVAPKWDAARPAPKPGEAYKPRIPEPAARFTSHSASAPTDPDEEEEVPRKTGMMWME